MGTTPGLDVGRVLPDGGARGRQGQPRRIGVVAGEGIGAEVVGAALDVLSALELPGVEVVHAADVDLGRARERGTHLPEDVATFCASTFAARGAVLCGPGGGRFVYELRERFDLFCKLTPVRPIAALADTGPLRPETVADVDVVFVRENSGGLYFGESVVRRDGDRVHEASHRFGYDRRAVDRLLDVAARLAATRRGRLAVVWKAAGVPALAELWRASAEEFARRHDVELEMIDVDNACYQVVARATAFDVVAAPNMFGDVVADVAALLLGSRGVSYSANFGPDGRAVYQTGHGAAHDLAGTDRANPVGQIQTLALLLEQSFGCDDAAARVRAAIDAVLAEGWRTADVASRASRVVGTRELGQRIAERAAGMAARSPVAVPRVGNGAGA